MSEDEKIWTSMRKTLHSGKLMLTFKVVIELP